MCVWLCLIMPAKFDFFFFRVTFPQAKFSREDSCVIMPFFRASGEGIELRFAGSTLLVADVSRGNIGQLAADLLITTLQMQRVGYFDDPDVLPAVGLSSPFVPTGWRGAGSCTASRGSLRTRMQVLMHWCSLGSMGSCSGIAGIEDGRLRVNTEVFATKDSSLHVLQQRSAFVADAAFFPPACLLLRWACQVLPLWVHLTKMQHARTAARHAVSHLHGQDRQESSAILCELVQVAGSFISRRSIWDAAGRVDC